MGPIHIHLRLPNVCDIDNLTGPTRAAVVAPRLMLGAETCLIGPRRPERCDGAGSRGSGGPPAGIARWGLCWVCGNQTSNFAITLVVHQRVCIRTCIQLCVLGGCTCWVCRPLKASPGLNFGLTSFIPPMRIPGETYASPLARHAFTFHPWTTPLIYWGSAPEHVLLLLVLQEDPKPFDTVGCVTSF